MPAAFTHTKDMWWEYYLETAIAGGPAGAAYATTAPSGAAELTPCNYPYNETQTMPHAEYVQEALEGPGQNITVKQTFTKAKKVLPGKIKQYVQNATWVDMAIAGTGGALPATFLFHYDDGQNQLTAYGCYITKYTFHSITKEAMDETLEFNAYDVEDEDVVMDTSPWDATAVFNHEDLAVTIGGQTCETVKEVTVEITKTYTEGPAGGSYLHKFPLLKKIDIEITVEWEDYNINATTGVNIWDDLLTEAATADLAITVDTGTKVLTATCMKVKPESTNINEIPEKGTKSYKATFEIGGACALSTG